MEVTPEQSKPGQIFAWNCEKLMPLLRLAYLLRLKVRVNHRNQAAAGGFVNVKEIDGFHFNDSSRKGLLRLSKAV